ncbi:hypothetical protein E2C01_093553 [Portunus trituberculatus]|uniref:Uncharacterized protein n=1 Tax=Portunus trituberculatus TaxID=210409 RepID=A0A5B7JYJ8_PORTR|nr:hypothetical protein [Portunus trituberculatus]
MESESYTNITDTLTDNINQTTNMLTGAQMEEPFNTLTLGPLTRSHLLAEFTCTAANSNLTKPAVLQITLEMSCESCLSLCSGISVIVCSLTFN